MPPPAPCSSDKAKSERERARFLRCLEPLLRHQGPKLLVTDSQVRMGLLLVESLRVC